MKNQQQQQTVEFFQTEVNHHVSNFPKKTSGKKKFIPKMSSHQEIQQRIAEKTQLILKFLGGGECWSSMKILSHLLELGERQTQNTLAKLVEKKFLKVEVLPDRSRLYGISPTGLALIGEPDHRHVFQIGKTPLSTVPHHLLSQKTRLELERFYEVKDWMPGKILFQSKFFEKVPDGLFSSQAIKVALELELYVKSISRMKSVLESYCGILGEYGDEMAILHKVLYFTPFPAPITKFFDRFVPQELRGRFLACELDQKIHSYGVEKIYFLNQELEAFLNDPDFDGQPMTS